MRDSVSAAPEPPTSTLSGHVVSTNPSHEIGLLSLGINQEARYIGPSSGYFLARVMLTKRPMLSTSKEATLPSELVEAVQGELPLPPRALAKRLCDAYFDVLHPQYPILHEPTITNVVDQMYVGQVAPASEFQVYMVFALGAVALGSQGLRIPGESYCLSAMKQFEQINIENSVQGLQCLLLLLLFSIHSPSVRLNAWYLNYQCIAAVLDLGLQRDITTASGISLLEQEMRTRIFWVVMMLDRTICTMMGRPIGIRDEACELRVSSIVHYKIPSLTGMQLPQGVDDFILSGNTEAKSDAMQYSVHLFQAVNLNSEIKYVANSVVRDNTPQHAYPLFTSIVDWQSSVLEKIENWASNIPSTIPRLQLICQIRYHNLRMLLLRSSPGIPKPSVTALVNCHSSALETIKLFDKMYRNNWLVHNWFAFHGLVLATLTMLYCIKAEPSIAQDTTSETLLRDMGTSLSILSAMGEHWTGVKRCRDILDDLGRSTIQWMQRTEGIGQTQTRTRRRETQIAAAAPVASPFTAGHLGDETLFDPSGYMEPFDFTNGSDSVNMDNIMQSLFQDFIPTYP